MPATASGAKAYPTFPGCSRGSATAPVRRCSAFVLRATAGLDAGFDFYDDHLMIGAKTLLSDVQRDGLDTLAASRDWLAIGGRRALLLLLSHL